MHLVNADFPILVCIDEKNRIGVYVNSLTNRLRLPGSGRSASYHRLHGHPFVT